MTGTNHPRPAPQVVLHVILSLEIGGMEQVVADLVRTLDPGRFTPVVACLQSLGPIAGELRCRGVRVVQVPALASKVSFLYPAALVRVIRETGAEIIHAHSGCWYKAVIAARLAGVRRIVYTEHGRRFPDSAAVMLADRIFSRWTSRVVAVSDELGRYLRGPVGIAGSKVVVIINGVDTSRFPVPGTRSAGGPVRIGIIARLAPVKDIATLLRAMQIVSQARPGAVLEVVGDGPERGGLERLAEELGLGNLVRFSGFRRDIPEVLAGMDIFTLCSLSEGTSVTLLEAMAAGKPVVATAVGGTTALINDGVNGYLVPAGDPERLAGALAALVGDKELRGSIGAANRETAQRLYSLQAMVRGYEELYATLD